MDTTAVIILALLIVLALGFFLVFRRRGRVGLSGPLGTRLELQGSNDPPAPTPGVRARDIESATGSVSARDKSGRGGDVAQVRAHKNVSLSNEAPGGSSGPKA
jgi:hypothetical protein